METLENLFDNAAQATPAPRLRSAWCGQLGSEQR